MADAPEPDLGELLWTIAVARILFGAHANIQAPPNLSPGALPQLVAAGINDWGGVSPVTQDYVNPEAPWPHLDALARETAAAGKTLTERLTIYPSYALSGERWLDPALRERVLKTIDSTGYPRIDPWLTGAIEPPPEDRAPVAAVVAPDIERLLTRARCGRRARRGRAGATLRGPRRRLRRGMRRCRRVARQGQRTASQLRGEPQHQLHQRLLFPLPVLRLFQGQAEREPARPPLRLADRRDRAAGARSLEPGRDGGLPPGRYPSRLHGRNVSVDLPRHQGGRARDPRPRLLAAGDLAGGSDARVARSRTSSRSCRRQGWVRCPAPPPRFSTTKCGR